MKWIGRRESSNIDDRRRFSGGHFALGGGVIGIVYFVVQLLFGGDTSQIINQFQETTNQNQSTEINKKEDEMAKYAAVVLADNEDVWNNIFSGLGKVYTEPKMVLFRGSTESDCGNADAAMGPFYCSSDQKLYMDLSFFEELVSRFGAKNGDFAIAYVIGHEVGHHIQNLLGTLNKVHQLESQINKKEANRLSVNLELQADFYAGVWAYHNQKMKNVIEEGDIDEALSAANAVGDDHLQKITQGYIMPDAFTHGTSEQRIYWFKKGFETGDINKGNTFKN